MTLRLRGGLQESGHKRTLKQDIVAENKSQVGPEHEKSGKSACKGPGVWISLDDLGEEKSLCGWNSEEEGVRG